MVSNYLNKYNSTLIKKIKITNILYNFLNKCYITLPLNNVSNVKKIYLIIQLYVIIQAISYNIFQILQNKKITFFLGVEIINLPPFIFAEYLYIYKKKK